MEEVRVLGRLQPDTEGGLVPANGSLVCPILSVPLNSRRRSKAGRKMAVARNKEAAGSFIGDIDVTKAEVGGNQEAAGSFGEISVTKAEVGNKEAADSFTGEIGVTKAEVGNKEAAGSFTGEIGVTKDELGNKEAAGPGMVTEASWINFVFLAKPPAGIERKAEPTVAMITKETVPDSFIDILKKRPLFKKLPPVNETSHLYSRFPELRDIHLSGTARRNYCIDLHEDVLRQHKLKGFAEVGVDFTDGVKKIFILPH